MWRPDAVVEAIELVVGPIELGVGAIAAVVEAGEGVAADDRVVGKWPKALISLSTAAP